MADFVQLKANYGFIDTPYDMLYSCSGITSLNISANVYSRYCVLSRVLGIVSAYIFPISGTFGLVSNLMICYIFTFKYRKKSRQIVFLTFMAASDFSFILSYGWLWYFTAKGLPYASGGQIYVFIVNISDMACRVYRCFYMSCSTWVFGAFLMVCLDRMLAIYLPMKMMKFGYQSAIVSSFVMMAICVVVTNVYTAFIKWRKISSKVYCTLSTGDDQQLLEFLNLWRILCVYSGTAPMILILFINICLISKIVSNNSVKRKLIEGSIKKDKNEIKATMVVFILSIFFFIGSVPNVVVYFLANFMENIQTDDISVKNELQVIYNLGDVGTHILFFMESLNIFIYYIKIKQFRLEFIKIVKRKPGRCTC